MDEICYQMANTELTVKQILNSKKEYPCMSVFHKWLRDSEEAKELYTEAKELQQHTSVQHCIEITTELPDWVYYVDKEGNRKVDTGAMAALKLQTETRKWAAARLARKTYGDRITIEDDTAKKKNRKKVQASVEEHRKKKVYDREF